MAHQVRWNALILQEFIRIGALTEDQELILRKRVAGWTSKRMHFELYVLAISGHVVCVRDGGDWYDSWDSGDEVVIYYWTKEG